MKSSVFVLLLLVQAVRSQLVAQVVGGKAPSMVYNWMVSVQFNDKHRCGGIMIGKNLMLTSKSCAYPNDPDSPVTFPLPIHRLSVIAQREDKSPLRMTVVERFFLHDRNAKEYNDIAIWKLKGGESLNLEPVVLASSVTTRPGNEVHILGWGKIASDQIEHSPKLLQASLKEIADDVCVKAYKGDTRVVVTPKTMICATAPGKDTCYGDGGGPLFRWIQSGIKRIPEIVGIISWGDIDCKGILPGIYTRVANYHKWIYPVVTVKKVDLLSSGRAQLVLGITETFARKLIFKINVKNSKNIFDTSMSFEMDTIQAFSETGDVITATKTMTLNLRPESFGKTVSMQLLIDNDLGLKWNQTISFAVPNK